MRTSIELKVFVPAKDYELSQRFYRELGFEQKWTDTELAYFHHGDHCAFLLQNYYVKDWAENLMMHLLVDDVEAWWAHVQSTQLAERYALRVVPPQDQPWRMRDFVIIDPSGVLWRISQNLPDAPEADTAGGSIPGSIPSLHPGGATPPSERGRVSTTPRYHPAARPRPATPGSSMIS